MKFPARLPEYEKLKSFAEDWGIVYGPVKSRRLGVSLGLNILGSEQKVCSYNCPYCEIGSTQIRMNQIKNELKFPSIDEIVSALKKRLMELIEDGTEIDAISMVGNGEATLNPLFPEIVDAVIEVKNDTASQTPLVLFTNASHIESRKVISAVEKFDQVMFKFDAGDDDFLKTMNEPLVRTSVSKLISKSSQLKNLIIQSCFVKGTIDNTDSEHLEEWMEAIALTNAREVHIYTLDRVPQSPGLVAVDEDTLDIIAQKVTRKTGIKAIAF